MRIITRVILFVAVVCLSAYGLYACGGAAAGRDSDIVVQLTYPGSSVAGAGFKSVSALSDANAPVAASYPLDPSNRILIRVLGPDFSPMEAWFSRSEGRGVIKNVPPGSKIVVEVDEYDSSAASLGTNAELLGRGWVQGITLAKGEAKIVDVAMHARGTILTICGSQAVNGQGVSGDSGDGGLATDARINTPLAVKVGPDDSIYISSYGNRKVKRIDRYGYISHFAGTGGSAPVTATGVAASSTPVGYVSDIDIDPSGNLYFITSQNQILKITDGIISKIVYDNVYPSSGQARSLAVVNDDLIFFVNESNPRIYRINGSSIDEFVKNDAPLGASEPFDRLHYPINSPSGITYASISNSLIFAESVNNRIMELSLSDEKIRYLVEGGNSFQEGIALRSMDVHRPVAVEYNPVTGKIFFIAHEYDPYNYTDPLCRVFYGTPNNTVRTFAGIGALGFSGDGSRSNGAQLSNPMGVSIDSRGNVYIADQGNHAIRMVVGGALGELPPP